MPRTLQRSFLACALTFALSVQAAAPPAGVPSSDLNRKAKIREQMVEYNPRYVQLHAARVPELEKLSAQVFAKEQRGEKAACSHQTLIELHWLLEYTADFPRIDRRLQDLRDSLAHPEREAQAEEQDPADGSFGRCYTEWMEKLDASYDYIEMYRQNGWKLKYPTRYLDRVNSPEKLKAYIDSVAVSDISHTGRDNRKELNGAFVNLIRLLETGQPAGYAWDPRLKQVLLDLVIHRYQNQQTGWWGEQYVRGNQTDFVDDLSITFHVVQALYGKVPLLDKLATTLFAVKALNYPVGWLENGQQTNHNNMDVIVLMRDSWQAMTPVQRLRGAKEIRSMLDWCLKYSLQKDGSFAGSAGGDDSVEEGTHFGVGFLARIGYFDKRKRFWTNENFPEAEANRQRILAFIKAHKATGAAGGTYYSSSLAEMTH